MNNAGEQFDWKIIEKSHTEEAARRILRLGVLISGDGSNLQALINAIEQNELPNVQIALVVSNKADAYGIQRALRHHIPVIYLPWEKRSAMLASHASMFACETTLTALLHLFNVDLIVCAGWMRIFTPAFVSQFPRRMINLHPALLPDNGAGDTFTTNDGTVIPVFRGLHVVRQALQAGVRITGSTLHYVTPEVDAGPVICRAEVAIEPDDTEESLHERIKMVEHRLIVEGVRKICLRIL
jgi:phosphoribosylglycinamide formyltransferase-1